MLTSVIWACLKYLAIGTTMTFGIVAALTKTRDETTARITRSGWTLVALMVASATIAAVTQRIEIAISNKQQETDRIHRLQEYEALYRLLNPLGDLRVQINATYPMSMEPDGYGNDWLRRVRDSVPPSRLHAVLNEPDNVLRPHGSVNSERAPFELLVEPEFDIAINVTQAQAFHDGLLFRTTRPQISRIYVHLDTANVDSQIVATTFRLTDARNIRSWRDLYDAEVTVYIPGFAPPGTRFTRISMSFLTGAQFGRAIEIPITEPLTRPGDYRAGYVHVLTDKELGPKPELHLPE